MSAALWTCQRAAGCCRLPRAVVMTEAERRAIEAHPGASGVALTFTALPDAPGKVALSAGPCPLLDGHRCRVYDARPYNCRRTACLRDNPRREPLILSTGPTGFVSSDRRVCADRRFRRFMLALEARAMKWAEAHGWTR